MATRDRAFLAACVVALASGIALAVDDALWFRPAGWWAAVIFAGAGVALGFRALALPFILCVTWGVIGHATDTTCVYECGGWQLVAFYLPVLLCVPTLLGALFRTGVLLVVRAARVG